MKLAISNIAWAKAFEPAVADLLQQIGLKGVEVAPTKIWDKPLDTTKREIATYRGFWENRGIRIVSMQALLFGRNDLTIFGSASTREATLSYLSGMVRLAGELGAEALVFGSPKNRQVGSLSPMEIEEIAIPFFRTLGEIAIESNTVLCIEPNPPEYGCDFVTNSTQAVALATRVESSGFRVHLDSGAMTMAGEDIESAIANALPLLCHFHVSEPNLMQIGSGGTDHCKFGRVLADLNYKRWISIEMRPPDTNCMHAVHEALRHALTSYST